MDYLRWPCSSGYVQAQVPGLADFPQGNSAKPSACAILQLPIISDTTKSHSSKCLRLMEFHNSPSSCPRYHGCQVFSALDAARLTEVSKVEAPSDFPLSLTVYVSFLVREYSSFERPLRLCEGCQYDKLSGRQCKNAPPEAPTQLQKWLFDDWEAMNAPAKDENV